MRSFSIIFSIMLQDAFPNNELGVYIQFRSNGYMFNLQQLKAKSNISELLVGHCLLITVCIVGLHIQSTILQ